MPSGFVLMFVVRRHVIPASRRHILELMAIELVVAPASALIRHLVVLCSTSR
jgi:hypothetical protein